MKELIDRYEIDWAFDEATYEDQVISEKKLDGEWCKWPDVAAALERNRWRRFGDEEPDQGDVVHVFRADGHAIAHFHADDVNQWHLGHDLFEAQPDDMWRPANQPGI